VLAAARARRRARRGQGALSFDDVLDAQRTLFELRVEYVDALNRARRRRGRTPDRGAIGGAR
jgi:outer membrane protein TolC